MLCIRAGGPIAAACLLASCLEAGSPDTVEAPASAHNSRNSLDWAGTYSGVIPCADCAGIETTVTLSCNGSFSLSQKYRGNDQHTFDAHGDFTWNAAGSVVSLAASSGVRQQYQVGENRLIFLDQNGQRIEGELAGRYVLTRVNP